MSGQLSGSAELGPMPAPHDPPVFGYTSADMRAYAQQERAAERERWARLVAELLDTELGDMASAGSSAPVEDILGRLKDAIGPNVEASGMPTAEQNFEDASAVHAVGITLYRRVRRVVCAAIRAADGKLLLGVRHYSRDMHEQIAARRDGAKFSHRMDEDQGFVDQWGVFMGREEAMQVALAADQRVDMWRCGYGPASRLKLYSEGLY